MSGVITIKSGKEGSLMRKHPWVFSGAVAKTTPKISQGEIVDVENSKGQFLGRGHYQHGGSIVVRILTFDDKTIDKNFWQEILSQAYAYRKKVNLAESNHTNAYRLIHGEGDGLPGLIIDVYGHLVVMQCHSVGMYLQRQEIADALLNVLPMPELTIYCRSKDTLPMMKDFVWEDSFLYGKESEVTILENNRKFKVNIVEGQKTGFFLDQRENRLLLSNLSSGKSVLNTFCYTGGFSVYALTSGALKVDSVDISEKAMALTDINIALNPHQGEHNSYEENVLNFFQNKELPDYDIVVVDPPAFAKSLAKRHNAVQAYKRLNIAALQKVKSGGFLFTFSCSQVVTPQLFYDTIVAAGIESGKKIRVVKNLSQGADHPVNLFHPEGHYLKGLLLYVG